MNRITVRVSGSRSIPPVTAWTVLLGAVLALAGCVSSSTYELAKQDAQNATLLLQQEQRRVQDLAAEHKRMTQRIEQLQADLQKTQQGLTVRDQARRDTRDELLQRAQEVLRWVQSGALKLHIGLTLPLSEASEAHRQLEGRETVGKILLTPG